MRFNLDKDAIKNSLTKDEVSIILDHLGSDSPQEDRNGNHIYQTVCHSGSNHKLYSYHESGNFQCYTNCGHIADIYDLVIRVKETQGIQLTFPESIRTVAELTGKRIVSDTSNVGQKSELIDDWDFINKVTKKRRKIDIDLPTYNENVLGVFMNIYHHSWLEEGISSDVMSEARIGWYFTKDAITIPHFNQNGELIGLRQRNTSAEDLENGRKYIPTVCGGVMYNHRTMYNLYNLDKSKNKIRESKKAIIFEGEKSCLLNRTYFGDYDFSVATSGSNISNYQVELLLSLGIEEVIIAFDKEYSDHESKEAHDYAKKLLRLARKFTPFVRVFVLWDTENVLDEQDSPIDKGLDGLLELMRNKIEIKTYGSEME